MHSFLAEEAFKIIQLLEPTELIIILHCIYQSVFNFPQLSQKCLLWLASNKNHIFPLAALHLKFLLIYISISCIECIAALPNGRLGIA
jgi:ABC-type arginine/histidine transport system permease subunit